MPRPCAVESHAYCYRRRHSPLLKMPRPCAVESHAHCYRRTLSPLLKMPRPCAVESHARCYRRTLSPLLKMPRPCAVESHARCCKGDSPTFEDATALRRGVSRSLLQKTWHGVSSLLRKQQSYNLTNLP